MKNRRNYYRLLQVQPDAPLEVIRASYRTLMRELKQHPDLGGSTINASLLNEAYIVLSDPERRADYDRELFRQRTKCEVPAEGSRKQPLVTIFCPTCKQPLVRKSERDQRCMSCHNPLPSRKAKEGNLSGRRTVTRAQLSKRIFYYSREDAKAKEAEIIDFSKKGMKFLCSEPLSPGSIVKIESPQFKATSRITHVYQKLVNGKQVYSTGVSFVTISFEEPRGFFLSTSV